MCILVILYKKPIFQEDSLKEKRNLKKNNKKKSEGKEQSLKVSKQLFSEYGCLQICWLQQKTSWT